MSPRLYRICARGHQLDGGAGCSFDDAARAVAREYEAGTREVRALGIDAFGRERELRAGEVEALARAAARIVRSAPR